MIPDRLAGWWLASVAGTAAVLLLSPPGRRRPAASAPPRSSPRRSPTSSTRCCAATRRQEQLRRVHRRQARAARAVHRDAVPPDRARPRPTRRWRTRSSCSSGARRCSPTACASAATCAARPRRARAARGRRARCCATPARCSAARTRGPTSSGSSELPRCRASARLRDLPPDAERLPRRRRRSPSTPTRSRSRSLAIGADALVAARRRRSRLARRAGRRAGSGPDVRPGAARACRGPRSRGVALRHASVRSVWFINSLRGALALAAAVAVADLSERPARLLGRARDAVGAAHERRRRPARRRCGRLPARVARVRRSAGRCCVAIGTNTTALWVGAPDRRVRRRVRARAPPRSRSARLRSR